MKVAVLALMNATLQVTQEFGWYETTTGQNAALTAFVNALFLVLDQGMQWYQRRPRFE